MVDLPSSDPALGCNCQYPIGLVVFLVFTIVSLLICICICCFDITNCKMCSRTEDFMHHKQSVLDPRFFDSSKFAGERKISLDPRLLEYSQLLNTSMSSSASRSFDLSRSLDMPYHSTDSSLMTTV